MRITHRMIAEGVNYNLQQSMRRMDQRSQQLSMGKAFSRPSEDPVGTCRVMCYRDSISRNERYRLNIDEARGWLQATEAALMEGLAVVQRIRDLSIYGANAALSQAELLSIAEEVDEFYDHLVGVGNSEYNGLYLFGGHRTGAPPYREGSQGLLEYFGDQGERRLEISSHQEIMMNLNGKRVFGGENGTGLMETVFKVRQALKEGDQKFLGGEALAKIDGGIDLLLERLSEAGARYNRIDAMESTLFEENIHLREVLSQVEDIDFAEALTEHSMEAYAYQAALATASRVLQPNLLDYLR
ncbi:MAG: flagellar hook-associated protein FlgL [Firmicutes bacterium]|nr:flagellar hook-associated protein FlgL [Bacillota bacterium]